MDIRYFKHSVVKICGHPVRAARLSYVGEFGWELTCKSQYLPELYRALVSAGAQPAGLYAQTSMRIEKGFCAMGHELDSDVTPLDVGLGFALRRDGGYIGAKAVAQGEAEGTLNTLYSLVFQSKGAVPLGHEPVERDGVIVGHTTSCAYGHRVDAPVALAVLSPEAACGDTVFVNIAGDRQPATVVRGPAFDPAGVRMRAPAPE